MTGARSDQSIPSLPQPESTGVTDMGPRDSVGMKLRPLLTVLTVFWVYVTLSNVLYAHSMQDNIASMSPGHYFAPWPHRVLQHLLLYPFFIGCVCWSLRIGWQPVWRRVPAQVLLGVGFAALAGPALLVTDHILVPQDSQMAVLGHPDQRWTPGVASWIASTVIFILTYGFGLALVTGLSLYNRYRDSQLRSAALERALTSAHLAALRMQLSPHTLFNLLHTIRGQIGWDPPTAESMIVQLGELLRRLLNAGEREFSRLAAELRLARLYLDLQQKRFADRLTVWTADVDDLPSVWVPSLILQPLIENAVVHGLAFHQGPVEIRVEAVVQGENLLLRVINSISPTSVAGRAGIGLRNVRERLAVQFNERAEFKAGASTDNVWIAEIRMPLLLDGPTVQVRRDARTSAEASDKPIAPASVSDKHPAPQHT